MKKFSLALLLLLLMPFIAYPFNNGDGPFKRTVNFGFQLEPIMPNRLFRIQTQDYEQNNVSFHVEPLPGISYGAVMQFGFTPKLSLETGINYLKRSYRISVDYNDFNPSLTFIADNYEIPLTLIYYVRLGDKLHMGHSVGFSFQILPSHLFSRRAETIGDGPAKYVLEQRSFRKYWLMPAFKGSFGFEYRTENNGSLFLGPVYHLFTPLYDTELYYMETQIGITAQKSVDAVGDYFGLVFRYSFPPTLLHRKPKKQKK